MSLYTDPGDLEADFTEAKLSYGADVANVSLGINVARYAQKRLGRAASNRTESRAG